MPERPESSFRQVRDSPNSAVDREVWERRPESPESGGRRCRWSRPGAFDQGSTPENFTRGSPCDQGLQRRVNARICHWAGEWGKELMRALARRVFALGSVNVEARGGLNTKFARASPSTMRPAQDHLTSCNSHKLQLV